jgi:hypothetical protein
MVLVQSKTRYACKLAQRYYYNKSSVNVSSPSTSNTFTKPRNLLHPFTTRRHRTVSTPTMSAPTSPGFNDLPTELQFEVLRCTLRAPRKIIATTHWIVYGPRLLSLSLVSKRFYACATQIYYKENVFRCSRMFMVRKYDEPNPNYLVRLPNLAVGKYVRRLEINIRICSTPGLKRVFLAGSRHERTGNTCSRPADILTLVSPKLDFEYVESLPDWKSGKYERLIFQFFKTLGEDQDRLVKWQKEFCALKHVKLTFELRYCLDDYERLMLETLPHMAKTYSRAQKIDLAVNHERATMYGSCKGQCIELIEHVFTKIVDEANVK